MIWPYPGRPVFPIALGCGALGSLPEKEAEALVHGALELGVGLFDTAISYGSSEERLGKYLRGRQAVISTKGGYGIEGVADWTREAITRGIDRALKVLGVDHLGIFHLHSCPLEILQRDELHEALAAAKAQGKIQVAAYSGDNRELQWAIESGRFGGVQASVSLFDQANLPVLRRAGILVLAKRPLGCAVWRGHEPHDDASRAYRDRMRAMALSPGAMGWDELAVRFAAYAPGVSALLVGTTRLENLRACVRSVEQGPLPPEVEASIRGGFHNDWPAMI